MTHVKRPVVAGLFYPEEPRMLRREVEGFVNTAHAVAPPRRPHALVAPHAGYRYSGPVAGSAYAALTPWADSIRRVVVLAPSHRVAFRGIALSNADTFTTPMGDITVDSAARDRLLTLPATGLFDAAFAEEHALEVQLPFLQAVLGEFTLVPIVVGDAEAADVAQVIEELQDDDTLIVVSSDLSHYHAYADCQSRDRSTSANIEALRGDAIGPHDACGAFPLRGLLVTAANHAWQVQTLDLRNSGDTSGDRSRVVGYGAYVFY